MEGEPRQLKPKAVPSIFFNDSINSNLHSKEKNLNSAGESLEQNSHSANSLVLSSVKQGKYHSNSETESDNSKPTIVRKRSHRIMNKRFENKRNSARLKTHSKTDTKQETSTKSKMRKKIKPTVTDEESIDNLFYKEFSDCSESESDNHNKNIKKQVSASSCKASLRSSVRKIVKKKHNCDSSESFDDDNEIENEDDEEYEVKDGDETEVESEEENVAVVKKINSSSQGSNKSKSEKITFRTQKEEEEFKQLQSAIADVDKKLVEKHKLLASCVQKTRRRQKVLDRMTEKLEAIHAFT